MTDGSAMEQPTHTFVCPNCNEFLAVEQPGTVICANCRWRGILEFFNGTRLKIAPAEEAHGDDAACAHHATKKATATCAGSGDYICPLCTVEIEGKTYSLQYLENAGSGLMEHQFERYLRRPDSQIMLYIAMVFFVPFTYLWLLLGIAWVPHAYALYFSCVQLRKREPLYRELVGRGRMVILLLALLAATVVSGIFTVYILRSAYFFIRIG